jgi:DNA mismatch repair protein MutS2
VRSVIPLLDHLDAAEREAVLPRNRQTERSLRLLEWPRVLDQIAGFCLNGPAAERVRQRRPYVRLEPIELQWQLADELRPLGEAGRWPPLMDVALLVALLERPQPLQLSGGDLVLVAAGAAGLDDLRDFFGRARVACPTWGDAAAGLAGFSALVGEIQRALERDGRLKDTASPALGRLRRAAAAQERAVRQAMDDAMAEARRQGWTTADEVTLRGDRFCLPLRAGARRRVQGIIHARSATGQTLFVEPAEVVDLHNELAELRLEIAGEEARILQLLNRSVERAAPSLRTACRFMLLVDEVRATLLWSREFAGRRPRLGAQRSLRICRARHPLLLQFGPRGLASERAPQEGQDMPPGGSAATRASAVIPLDLELPPEKRVVVISGPNAGGKSVALKTVGVLTLLAQSGWDVPAREDTSLPFFQRLFVDLGDEQSIEQSLSSFSAHLGHLVDFLAAADVDTLVLCDEIGSGTDPEEGTALAFTVLEGLAERDCTVLASTHLGLLKAAVHDHPAMVNAAMDYDEQTLRPLFTLRLGVPGTSHAFDIAGRWGFPPALLARARARVGEERFQIERLLTELGSRARSLAESESEARQRTDSLRRREEELAQRLSEIEKERLRLLADTRQEGEELLREGRSLLERAVREIRSTGGDRVVTRRAREELERLSEHLPAAAPGDARSQELTAGQRVHIPHLGLSGRVVEVRGERIIAEANGLRLTLTRDALEVAATPPEESETPARADGGWRWREGPPELQHEIDLRGQRGEEAWAQLDLLIDRSIPAGLDELLVIHGVGTGRLRGFLQERLAADPRVSYFEDAPLDRGGHGATIIRLAGS